MPSPRREPSSTTLRPRMREASRECNVLWRPHGRRVDRCSHEGAAIHCGVSAASGPDKGSDSVCKRRPAVGSHSPVLSWTELVGCANAS
eukprot:6961804-Prymnesium_polylepis.1